MNQRAKKRAEMCVTIEASLKSQPLRKKTKKGGVVSKKKCLGFCKQKITGLP
jgi:hypothetical protein